MEGDYFFGLNTPTTRHLFGGLLANSGNVEDMNIFRRFNMIERTRNGRSFRSPIGHIQDVEMEQGGVYRVYMRMPLLGDISGIDPNSGALDSDYVGAHNDTFLSRPYFDLKTAKITAPKMGLPGEYIESLVTSSVFGEHFEGVRSFWDHNGSEVMHTYLSGTRGNYGNQYETLRSKSVSNTGDPGTAGTNERVRGLQVLSRANPLKIPSRQVATWEDTPGKGNYVLNYGTPMNNQVSHRMSITFLQNLSAFLKQRTRARDEIGFDKCSFMVPGSSGATDMCWPMLAPSGVIKDLKQQSGGANAYTHTWWDFQLERASAGIETGITTGAVGKIDNILLIEDDYVPIVKTANGVLVARMPVLGQQALVYGHKIDRRPVRYRARDDLGTRNMKSVNVPYRIWASERADGHQSALVSSTVVGYALPTFENTDGVKITKGVVSCHAVVQEISSENLA